MKLTPLDAAAAAMVFTGHASLFFIDTLAWFVALVIGGMVALIASDLTTKRHSDFDQHADEAQELTRPPLDEFDRLINARLHEFKGTWPEGAPE